MLTVRKVPRAAQWTGDAFQRTSATRSDGEDLQGKAVSFAVVEPWGEPVEGATLLDQITDIIRKHVVLPAHAPDALALWIVHTYLFALFDHTPRVALVSPEKRCGKTQVLILLRALVHRALSADNITSAAVFRVVERDKPTLLIDEADTFLKDNEELRGILNSGHARDGSVTRCVGDGQEPRGFATFCPVAIALIGKLPGTVEDRAIVLAMRRKAHGERCVRIRAAKLPGQLVEVRRKIMRWVVDNRASLEAADPSVPESLDDRAQDNWRPLLAIADAAGGEWRQRARAAALVLSGGRDDNSSIGALLLADLRRMFDQLDADRITSAGLVAHLIGLEERPWPEWKRGQPMTPRNVASLLAPFGIVPGTIRLEGGSTAKGYLRDSFADAFERYLPAHGSVTTSQTRESAAPEPLADPSRDAPVTDPKAPGKSGFSGPVTEVTDRKSEDGEAEAREHLRHRDDHDLGGR